MLEYVCERERIAYTDENAMRKLQDYEDELEKREPFRPMKRQIDKMEEEIQQLKRAMSILGKHMHNGQGEVVVAVKEIRVCDF